MTIAVSLLCRIVRGSFHETASRKTSENTIKHRNCGVGSIVDNKKLAQVFHMLDAHCCHLTKHLITDGNLDHLHVTGMHIAPQDFLIHQLTSKVSDAALHPLCQLSSQN